MSQPILPRLESEPRRSRPEMAPPLPAKPVKASGIVIQACQSCRRSKVKCDGGRPHCSPCTTRKKACHYEGAVGQSRKAAVRSRLTALEKLFDALQSGPEAEAEQILQEIRRTGDLASISEVNKRMPSLPSPEITTTDISVSGSSSVSGDSPAGPDYSRGRSRSNWPRLPMPKGGFYGGNDSDTSSDAACTTPAFMPISRHILGAGPSRSIIEDAISSFFRSSGELFHIFSREQIKAHSDHAFDTNIAQCGSKNSSLCCVSIVAAIGVQYSPAQFKEGLDEALFDIARHHYVSFIEEQQLDAVKVCVLLAMYSIMNKATVAVAYLALGLFMSQKHALHDRTYRSHGLSEKEIVDHRRTWRTLMFFSSWLSSTLGSPMRNEAPFQRFCALGDVEIKTSDDVAEVVQAEMTKVTILAADMIRMHLSQKKLTPAGIGMITRDLQKWHDQLPPEMDLRCLGPEVPFLVQMSIYQVHLLYMGALILVYRRISSQFAIRLEAHQKLEHVSCALDKTVHDCANQGLIASRHTSRIIELMRGEDGVFQRCWLVIFHAYISCAILLHSVAQMQTHQYPPSAWKEDLERAKICQDTLEFCGAVDLVAFELQKVIAPILAELDSFDPPVSWTSTPTVDTSDLGYLFVIPSPSVDRPAQLAVTLFLMISRAFTEQGSDQEYGDIPSVGALWQPAKEDEVE